MSIDGLIQEFISQGQLKTLAIIEAFKKIKRRDFLPAEIAAEEAINAPLPIGEGQTNSQPYTVAFMLELLQPQSGQKILDIGAGSGWTTALLAEIVGPGGHIYAIERIASVKEFGQQNVQKYNFTNVDFYCQDGSVGLPQAAPFARILVSASAYDVPEPLKEQLTLGGRLVIPTAAQDIRLIERISKNKFKEDRYPGFVFVPLVTSQL